jgi:hypothetical protein
MTDLAEVWVGFWNATGSEGRWTTALTSAIWVLDPYRDPATVTVRFLGKDGSLVQESIRTIDGHSIGIFDRPASGALGWVHIASNRVVAPLGFMHIVGPHGLEVLPVSFYAAERELPKITPRP